MCGIAGYFLPQTQADDSVVRRMCDQIVHRGPDDHGYHVDGGCAIGMRRLSVIDLSTGHQPISNEDGSIWIVFNGEVYNYQTLREQLLGQGHRFRTNSDTETLVHLYEQEGVEGLHKLRGMYGYAIWDGRRRRLLLVRDRFGKKPLYYSQTKDGIYFGSELKCLRAAGIPLDLDEEALRYYFQLLYIPDPHSPFRQVKKLEPGGWLLFDSNGTVQRGQYWRLPPSTERIPDVSQEELKEELRAKFDESVRLRMVADVPLGAFLSGGIDSGSVVASMARQSSRPVKTFSIGFEEARFNELNEARLVAEMYKTDHHELVVRPNSVDLVPRLVKHFDEPFGDSSAIPTLIVSEFARQTVTVVLTGDGGDEMFAGYDSFLAVDRLRRWDAVPQAARRLMSLVSDALPSKAYGKNYLHMISRPTPLERYFEFNYGQLQRTLIRPQWSRGSDEATLRRDFAGCLVPNGADIVTQALYFEATAKLTGDMLVKVDRMSMAASIEVRCPLLDHELAELAARIPAAWKMKGGRGKAFFIETFADRLPPGILNLPKRGFSVPLEEWFRGPLKAMLWDQLLSRRFLQRGFVSEPALRQMLEEHDTRRRNHRSMLWSLLMLDLWWEAWREVAAPEPVRR